MSRKKEKIQKSLEQCSCASLSEEDSVSVNQQETGLKWLWFVDAAHFFRNIRFMRVEGIVFGDSFYL